LFVEILLVFALVVVAGLLYFLFRALIQRLSGPKGRPVGMLLSRLNLPLAFLIVSLVLQIHPIRNALFPSEILHPYFDAALIFSFIFLLIRLVDGILVGWHAHRHREFPLPRVLHSLTLAVFYLSLLFLVLNGVLGIDITPFLATSAILTMILGLAFQGVLSNILAGMSLHFTRSFNKNDWIQVGDHEGMVLDTNWRETRIFDRLSNIIVLPNNIVASEKITNFSQPDKKTALTIPVRASYDAPPSFVLEALLEAARDVPEVLDSPAPEAYVLSYDDFGISYVVKFWIRHFARKYPIMTEVGRLIWYKFKRRNIEIPIPVSEKIGEVMRSIQTQGALSGVPSETERNFQDLMKSSFLRYQEGEKKGELLVPEEEIRAFASHVVRHKFAAGEYIFKQGERGEFCFIVASGKIKGEIAYEEKGKKYKSEFTVEPGGLFGEMSLFTGMPRTATGIVGEESELLKIDTTGFSRLLESNPELADLMAGLVSERNKKNQDFLKKIKELSAQDIEVSTNRHSILSRLKKFIKKL
jgi:small-conductance mechanosensitive channel/CRP-like cAMP-binding protein